MKTLLKAFITVSILCAGNAFGQEFKSNVKNIKKIEIGQLSGEVTITGTSGSELIIKADGLSELPERAKGLKPLSAGGTDNTNLGLNVAEAANIISISGATKQSSEASYTFMVPEGIAVKLDYTSPFTSSDVQVKDFKNEIEISTMNGGINCENVSGPLIFDVINGDITIMFSAVNQSSPMSVKSINGEVDLTLPSGAKADFDLSSLQGDIYTDLDILVDKKENENGEARFLGGMNSIKGKLNGGGVKVTVSSINGNLYLRKK
jgi:hypothetical protein